MTSERARMTSERARSARSARSPAPSARLAPPAAPVSAREPFSEALSVVSSRPRSAPLAGASRRRPAGRVPGELLEQLEPAEPEGAGAARPASGRRAGDKARRRPAPESAGRESRAEAEEVYESLRYELARVRRQLELARAENEEAVKAEAERQALLAERLPAQKVVEDVKDEAQANSREAPATAGSRRAQPSKPAVRKGAAPPGRAASRPSPRRPPGFRRAAQAPGPRALRTIELAKRAEARTGPPPWRAGPAGEAEAAATPPVAAATPPPVGAPGAAGTRAPADAREAALGRDGKFRTTSSVIGSWVDAGQHIDSPKKAGVYYGRPKFIWASEDHPHWKTPGVNDRSAAGWMRTSAAIGREECWTPLTTTQQRAEVVDMQRTSYGFLLTLNKEADEDGNGFLGGLGK